MMLLKFILYPTSRDLKVENLLLDANKNIKIIGECMSSEEENMLKNQ
jgi:hypothetical protein